MGWAGVQALGCAFLPLGPCVLPRALVGGYLFACIQRPIRLTACVPGSKAKFSGLEILLAPDCRPCGAFESPALLLNPLGHP